MKVAANFKAELEGTDIVAEIDTREQWPWPLTPLRTISKARQTGDYGLAAAPDYVALERKSLNDLICCCTSERERFEREVERLRAFPIRFLIVESSWQEIEAGAWRSSAKPNVLIGSLLSWACGGLPFILADNHERASQFAARILFQAARKKWRECREFAAGIMDHPTELVA
jgi:DNA excision repair protein ERCC-4